MVICVALLFFTIKENKLHAELEDVLEEKVTEIAKTDDSKKDTKLPKDVMQSLIFLLAAVAFWFIAYNAVTTAFSRYATSVWGLEGGDYANCLMVATVAAIISYIPIGSIATKIGRKKTILIGIFLLGSCFFAASLFNTYDEVMMPVFLPSSPCHKSDTVIQNQKKKQTPWTTLILTIKKYL